MALTRKFLSAMGIEADKVDEIINAHVEVTDALKEERDRYKADADALPAVKKELDDLRAEADKGGKDAYKVKYDAIKEEFDKYKADVSAKELKGRKEKAYKELLKQIGVDEKRLDAIMKVTDVTGMELDENGAIIDASEIKKTAKAEWSDFIVSETKSGASVVTPPGNTGGRAYGSKEDIMAIKDIATRQKAIAENHELFGF